jgi:hypothetical protein
MEKKENKKRKVYQKPGWQKQEMFVRFALSCAKKYGGKGCTTDSQS